MEMREVKVELADQHVSQALGFEHPVQGSYQYRGYLVLIEFECDTTGIVYRFYFPQRFEGEVLGKFASLDGAQVSSTPSLSRTGRPRSRITIFLPSSANVRTPFDILSIACCMEKLRSIVQALNPESVSVV